MGEGKGSPRRTQRARRIRRNSGIEIDRNGFEGAAERSYAILRGKIDRIASGYMASELAHEGRRFRSGVTVARGEEKLTTEGTERREGVTKTA